MLGKCLGKWGGLHNCFGAALLILFLLESFIGSMVILHYHKGLYMCKLMLFKDSSPFCDSRTTTGVSRGQQKQV